MILWLGDFTRGALNFDGGVEIQRYGVWHKIKEHVHHWSDPHGGNEQFDNMQLQFSLL